MKLRENIRVPLLLLTAGSAISAVMAGACKVIMMIDIQHLMFGLMALFAIWILRRIVKRVRISFWETIEILLLLSIPLAVVFIVKIIF